MKPISIVIITYNRPDDLLALLQNIATLNNKESLLEEVIIFNNNSSVDYGPVKKFIQDHPSIPYRYFESEVNLGVSGGRNAATRNATAPILFLIDDDVELSSQDALTGIVSAFENDSGQRLIGAVSFKVMYYDTREMQVNAFPHKQFRKRRDLEAFNTYYYAGCAHALLKEVLEKAGYLEERFFYGMEEYDLSYRLLDLDYRIVYNNSVVVLHKESPLGRITKREKLRMSWVNKSIVAYRYLPLPYFVSTAFLWSLRYLKLSKFDVLGFCQGYRQVIQIPYKEKRKVLKSSTLKYLKECKARLSY